LKLKDSLKNEVLRRNPLNKNFEDLDPMARDFKLLQEYDDSDLSEPILFFYTWTKPAISLGKIQKQKQEILEEAHRLGLDCYTRPTGGRAVLHGGDICYTFIAPQSHPEFGGPLKQSFKKTNGFIKAIINQVLNCDIADADFNLPNPSYNCFSSCVENEGIILIENQLHKIMGSAQAMARRSFIQQGSIQLNKLKINSDFFVDNKTLGQITGIDYDLEILSELLNEITTKYFYTQIF
jgi:lipoate-protein ligase A